MARILVFGFERREQADAARAAVQRLEREGALGLRGAAIGWRDEGGEVHIDHAVPIALQTAGTGAVAGGVLGLFLLTPVLGVLLGGLASAAGAALSSLGLTELHAKRITEALQPGRAALFVLADPGDPGRLVDELRPFAPTVLDTTLPEWDEEELVRALREPGGGTS